MKKELNKKGFTLAELLIVVAIIAVLVAIAIPVFGAALERSRDATDKANLRAAYAQAVNAELSYDGSATSAVEGFTPAEGTENAKYETKVKKQGLDQEWTGGESMVLGSWELKSEALPEETGDQDFTVEFDKDGVTSIKWGSAEFTKLNAESDEEEEPPAAGGD